MTAIRPAAFATSDGPHAYSTGRTGDSHPIHSSRLLALPGLCGERLHHGDAVLTFYLIIVQVFPV